MTGGRRPRWQAILARAEVEKVFGLRYLWSTAIFVVVSYPLLSAPIVHFQVEHILGALGVVEASQDDILTMLGDPVVGFGLIGGVYAGYLLVPCLIVLAVAADQTTGMNMHKMVLIPARWKHVAAEAAVLTLISTCGAVVGGALGVIVARVALDAHGIAVPLAPAAEIQAVARLGIGCAMLALMVVGIAYLVRRPGVALGLGVFLLFLAPFLLQLMPGLDQWSAALPSTALERFTLTDYSPRTSSILCGDPERGRDDRWVVRMGRPPMGVVLGGWPFLRRQGQ
ncbi:MAG: hypothetical protein LBR58_04435 [Propionibacteriaceae bacterium]|jgi:hypothetical protein|nr:hypothetical protein [Propionibacteriaceae bacterium]